MGGERQSRLAESFQTSLTHVEAVQSRELISCEAHMKTQLNFVSALFLVTDPEPHYMKNKNQFCNPPPPSSISPPGLHNIRINLLFLARENDIRILWKCFIQVLIIFFGGGQQFQPPLQSNKDWFLIWERLSPQTLEVGALDKLLMSLVQMSQ